jgi:hypothetical protein
MKNDGNTIPVLVVDQRSNNNDKGMFPVIGKPNISSIVSNISLDIIQNNLNEFITKLVSTTDGIDITSALLNNICSFL